MNNKNHRNNSHKIFNKTRAIIVWIMIALIPSIIGLHLFKYIAKTRQNLEQAKTKQNLLSEAYKHNQYLNTHDYLVDALDYKQTHKLYNDWILQQNNTTFRKIRKSHPIINQLPSFKGIDKSELQKFCKLIETKLGAFPNAAFIFSESLEECNYFIAKPFKNKFSDMKMRKALTVGADLVIRRLHAEREDRDLSAAKSRFNFEEIVQPLRLMQAIHVDLHSIKEQYTMATNDLMFILSYTIKTDNNQIKLLHLIYDTQNLSSKRTLRYALNVANKGNFNHRFGWTKKLSLPFFQTINNKLFLTCALPEKFQKLCNKRGFTKTGYKPVIRISAKHHNESIFKYKTIVFIVKIYLITTLLFAIGYSLQQFTIFKSLKKMMTIAFIAGILFPVTNLIWLSLSYLYVHEEKISENQQMYMKTKINELEDGLRLEKFKQNSFVRVIADKIEKFSYKKRKNSNKYIPFNKSTPESKKMRWNFFSLLTINADGTTTFHFKDNINNTSIKNCNNSNLLKGPFLQALSRLNAFHSIPIQKQKKILQMAELLIEMIEGIFEPSSVGNLMAKSGDFISQDYTIGEAYLNTFILRNQRNEPDGICSFNSNNRGWFNKFKQRYQGEKYVKPFKQYYNENGFSTVVYLLETSTLQDGVLKTVTEEDKKMNMINISDIAISLFAKSNTCQINNLNHTTQPHLIVGEFLNDLHIYAIAYSIPINNSNNILLSISIVILILLILISAIALAQGVASVLLVNIPQFSNAISKSENQNYKWHININSGNEFEELADAFNGMASKMQERQKLGELVSQNVIDAISSDNENMLKPGGERVNASILFTDIRSFTTISETYSADEVVEMLNGYFTIMSEIIEKHGGIIDKFIGDAIQAVFYDNQKISASFRATEAAIEMLSTLSQFNIQRKKANKFLISNGIGITTGQVISGRVGTAEGKLDATVIGSKLIHAMELEALTKFTKETPILLDMNTKKLISDKYATLDFVSPQETQLSIKMFELQL